MAIRIYQGTGGGYSIYTINGMYIENSSSGKIVYKINGNYIEDFSSGRTVYKINGKYIEDFSSGKIVYYIDNPSSSSNNHGISDTGGSSNDTPSVPVSTGSGGDCLTILGIIFAAICGIICCLSAIPLMVDLVLDKWAEGNWLYALAGLGGLISSIVIPIMCREDIKKDLATGFVNAAGCNALVQIVVDYITVYSENGKLEITFWGFLGVVIGAAFISACAVSVPTLIIKLYYKIKKSDEKEWNGKKSGKHAEQEEEIKRKIELFTRMYSSAYSDYSISKKESDKKHMENLKKLLEIEEKKLQDLKKKHRKFF